MARRMTALLALAALSVGAIAQADAFVYCYATSGRVAPGGQGAPGRKLILEAGDGLLDGRDVQRFTALVLSP